MLASLVVLPIFQKRVKIGGLESWLLALEKGKIVSIEGLTKPGQLERELAVAVNLSLNTERNDIFGSHTSKLHRND